DLKGTRTEHGFKWAFISLFGEDVETYTSTIFLYVDQLEKQLDKDEFQEDDSMNAFWMQMQEGEVDRGKALDVDLVVTESSGTESEKHDTNSRSGNDTLKTVNYKEPMAEAQMTTEYNAKDNNDSLIAQINSKTVENADLKAQIQEKVFANAALKNELRNTKFAKASILRKPPLQPLRNQSVVRQPNAFKFERPRI
ncbi:hypothetical protein Tco_0349332, partial [Tanacetum coccineum]